MNYRDSGYDDKYNFWEAKDIDEVLTKYLDEFVDFLVNEKVVNLVCLENSSNKENHECDDSVENVKKILRKSIKNIYKQKY